MDNKTIANIFYETADLMEVAASDPFRIRSYRRAAEAIEALSQQVAEIIGDDKAMMAVPGIGKGIEDYRRISGRFHLDEADQVAQKLMDHLAKIPGVDKITPAGSFRRGRETVGDLDMLVTGACCVANGNKKLGAQREVLIQKVLAFPGILQVIAQGEN